MQNLVAVSHTVCCVTYLLTYLAVPKKFPSKWGRDRLLKHASSYLNFRAKFDHPRSNSTSEIIDVCQKKITHRVPPWRSLEPTRIDRIPMTSN